MARTSVNPHCGQRNPNSFRCMRAALHFGHSGGAAPKLISAPTADAVPAADASFLLPVIADSTVSKAPNADAACPRSHQSGGRCLSFNLEAPLLWPRHFTGFRGFPASLRFRLHAPVFVRLRGSFPTWGTPFFVPDRRSAANRSTPFPPKRSSTGRPRARPMAMATCTEGATRSFSIRLSIARLTPARSATSAWVNPRASRAVRTRLAAVATRPLATRIPWH